GFVAGGVGDRDLELVGARAALHATHADAVGAGLLEADGREIGDDVGRDVLPRVAHFVEELLGDGADADPAAGPVVLGDDEGAVGRGLDDRVADVVQVGDRLPVEEAVAAGRLGAALVDVAGHDAGGEPVDVVRRPAEGVDHGRVGERGIGRAAGDDDGR